MAHYSLLATLWLIATSKLQAIANMIAILDVKIHSGLWPRTMNNEKFKNTRSLRLNALNAFEVCFEFWIRTVRSLKLRLKSASWSEYFKPFSISNSLCSRLLNSNELFYQCASISVWCQLCSGRDQTAAGLVCLSSRVTSKVAAVRLAGSDAWVLQP